ncbi:MAG: hypothetical protein J5676_08065 [Bacteroidaceae bacterium]|nr:hypothetical protein [Bacteroidaceae bacterium]
MLNFNKLENTQGRDHSMSYLVHSVCILMTLVAVGGVLIGVYSMDCLKRMLVIIFAYNVFMSVTYTIMWKFSAMSSSRTQLVSYVAVSAFKIVTALVVVWIYFRREPDITMRKIFTMTFMVFYLSMLFFNTLYFAKIQREKE